MSYVKEIFLSRREGKIVVFVSLSYLLTWGLLRAFPGINALSEFYIWMCGFMPVIMLIFYFSMGGFKRQFDSGTFNSAMLAIVSLTPVIMKLSVLVRQ